MKVSHRPNENTLAALRAVALSRTPQMIVIYCPQTGEPIQYLGMN